MVHGKVVEEGGAEARGLRLLKLTRARRQTVIQSVEKLHALTCAQPVDLPMFKSRYETLDDKYKLFLALSDEMREAIIEFDLDYDEELETIDRVENLYYEIKAAASQLLPTTEVSSAREGHGTGSQAARLPKVNIPVFDGELANFRPFHDIFCSLIHTNAQLTDIEKFHYLIGSVKGNAYKIVTGLPLISENYAIAWNNLVRQYENKRLLALQYLDKIINAPVLQNDSVDGLQCLIENFSENVSALKAMNIPNLADFILFHLAVRAFDKTSRKQFEMEHHQLEFPLIDDILKFGRKYVNILQSSGSKQSITSNPKITVAQRTHVSPKTSLLAASENVKPFLCPFCSEQHKLHLCNKFIAASVEIRRDFIKSKNICFNCVGGKHKAKDCRSRWSYRHCSKKHHSLLCANKTSEVNMQSTSRPNKFAINDRKGREESNSNGRTAGDFTGQKREFSASELACPTSHVISQNSIILLGTAIVSVKSASGAFVNVRVLIDPASQASFITTACQQRLGLPRKHATVSCQGLAGNPVTTTKGITSLLVRPRHGGKELVTNAIVIPKITSKQPSAPMPDHLRDNFRCLVLADPEFNKPGDIDALLGAELYSQIMIDGPIIRSEGNPTAWPSVFGYILIGPVDSIPHSLPSYVNISSCIVTNEGPNLKTLMELFWKVEEIPSNPSISQDEEMAEQQFKKLHYRENDGRYVVPLLFKENYSGSALGQSQFQALKRYSNLEHKLTHNFHLQSEYNAILNEYLTLGHISLTKWGSGKYFIPHHAVVKESSATTKVRVVFDASAQTSSGSALNDMLLNGPKLHQNIVDLILRFRLHVIAIVADISKMYRMIWVRPDHRRYQHIIWRPNENSTLQEYEVNTVTFGLASSPYLAMRVLQQLSRDEAEHFPLAASILQNDLFVDDLISGSTSSSAARDLITQLIGLLRSGGFKLHKWGTNAPDVLQAISSEVSQRKVAFISGDGENFKILGLCWDPKLDLFSYDVQISSIRSSKRGLLSNLAQLFDPLGWISPVVFWAKHFMQGLWKSNIGWDDDLPTDVIEPWKRFVNQLPLLINVKIPRHVCGLGINDTDSHQYQLLGFCDASEKGYCAVVYLRCGGLETKGKVYLQMAKTKVAPIKLVSIPRLELLGAVLLTKLLKFVHASLSHRIPIGYIYAWTDSTTVLAWINTPSHLLKAFVAHRVIQISESRLDTMWKHISSKDNPADAGSRGLFPQQITQACEIGVIEKNKTKKMCL